jgi:GTP-binding protein HflX
MIRAVDDVLEEIGAGESPRVLVLNKADVLDGDRREELGFRHPEAVLVAAVTGEGLDALSDRIEAEFRRTLRSVDLLLPYAEGGRLAELHALAGDLVREETPDGVRVRARLPVTVAERYERFAFSA